MSGQAPTHPIDEAVLERYLAEHVASFAGPLSVEQIAGGQSNPTYILTTPARRYILRRKPPGTLLPSAHAVDREYRIITALQGTGVPVPRSHVLCEDPAVIGTAFYVMEFVDGRVLWDAKLPDLSAADRRAVYEDEIDVLARLHSLDVEKLGLSDYGRPGNYVARQIARWGKQYQSSKTEEIAEMERLLEWLPAHVPESTRTTIVHGDYRLDNMIFDKTAPRVRAVIDWEISTLGDPLADFSYTMMTWRLPAERGGLRGVDLAALGIPTEAELVERYRKATGRGELPHWEFYLAYNFFRLACIQQGVYGRYLNGTAANPARAVHSGKQVRPNAEEAWAIASRLD